MPRTKLLIVLLASTWVAGCTHLADLQACRPPLPSPDLFSDHVGWDHQSVDEVRCSNEALMAVRHAREEREAKAAHGLSLLPSQGASEKDLPEGDISISLEIMQPEAK